ncbi:MAG: hypothetical protein JSV93_05685 [Candidatus Omnitrophota bacterium]|nr:MAG: hypothetical protein JSV93_05685 [Candidatus Omnitrophota bacterium]
MFKHSLRIGFSFGLTSGIITTLGLMVGLNAGTHSRLAVIGGILTIAIADAFSDALGIHMSEESENKHTPREVWVATLSTFFSKLIFALTFIIPVLLFELAPAVLISIIWGLSMLCVFSYRMAKEQHATTWKVVAEHFVIALVVIVVTYCIGNWASSVFG